MKIAIRRPNKVNTAANTPAALWPLHANQAKNQSGNQ